MNTEPPPGLSSIQMLPPSNATTLWQIASPRPVPPYLRVVDPSACGDSHVQMELFYLYTRVDCNGNGEPDECDCPADIDNDCEVGFADVLAILAVWGPCADCPEDVDGDGEVGFNDLLRALVFWGPCL